MNECTVNKDEIHKSPQGECEESEWNTVASNLCVCVCLRVRARVCV